MSEIQQPPSTPQAQPTLYTRLGGVYSIAAVIDDFIDRVMADPALNKNPLVDEAHHRVSPAGFKYLVTEMVCWATGGPQRYSGRAMRDSHIHLKITHDEWEAFLRDLHATLDKFAVPERERGEILAIVESTRGDIVIGEPPPPALQPSLPRRPLDGPETAPRRCTGLCACLDTGAGHPACCAN